MVQLRAKEEELKDLRKIIYCIKKITLPLREGRKSFAFSGRGDGKPCVITPPRDFLFLRDRKSRALPQGEGDLSDLLLRIFSL